MAKKCDKKKAIPSQSALTPQQPPEACEVRTILPIPDELKEPPKIPTPQDVDALILPKGLLIYNHEKWAYCNVDAGQYGDPIIIPEHRLEQMVYFSSVLSIKEEVLDYIARKELEYSIQEHFHVGNLTPANLRKLTGMRLKEAKELLTVMQGVQDELDKYAQMLADNALSCIYKNRPQTVRCEDEEVLRPEEYEGAVYEVTVEAGKFTSSYSQEDADNQALEYAQSLLHCLYGNPPFTARCEERPDRPLPVMDPVPNDEEEVYPGKGMRVGVVEVPANTFVSEVSPEDALAQAMEWGYAQLVCWYPNDLIELRCTDPDARNEFLDPLLCSPQDADIEKELYGQHVVVPEGYITSELSVEEATKEAQMLAEPLLQCCFINDELIAECQSENVITSDGMKYAIEPDRSNPACRVVVPRGKFSSCVSKEEANELARQYIEGALTCTYCNIRILPVCVPDWITKGVLDGKITLPLTGPVITDGVNSIPLHRLPPEATVGVEADRICLTSAQQAQQLAETLAIVPANGAEGWCTCYSEEVIVGCSLDDPYGNGVPSGGRGYKENGEPYHFFSVLPENAPLSATHSYPQPGEYIRFAAGLYAYNCFGLLDDEDANEHEASEVTQRVIEMAKTLIHCFIENPVARGQCEEVKEENDYWADTWYFGLGKPKSPQITPWSYTEENYIEFPAGIVFREVPPDGSKTLDELMAEIYEETEKMVQATIICMYYNTPQQEPCVPPKPRVWSDGELEPMPRVIMTCTETYRQANEAYVPANTIVAETPEEADKIAYNLAKAMAACDVDTVCEYEAQVPEEEEPVSSSAPSPPFDGPPPNPPDGKYSSSAPGDVHGSRSPGSSPVSSSEENVICEIFCDIKPGDAIDDWWIEHYGGIEGLCEMCPHCPICNKASSPTPSATSKFTYWSINFPDVVCMLWCDTLCPLWQENKLSDAQKGWIEREGGAEVLIEKCNCCGGSTKPPDYPYSPYGTYSPYSPYDIRNMCLLWCYGHGNGTDAYRDVWYSGQRPEWLVAFMKDVPGGAAYLDSICGCGNASSPYSSPIPPPSPTPDDVCQLWCVGIHTPYRDMWFMHEGHDVPDYLVDFVQENGGVDKLDEMCPCNKGGSSPHSSIPYYSSSHPIPGPSGCGFPFCPKYIESNCQGPLVVNPTLYISLNTKLKEYKGVYETQCKFLQERIKKLKERIKELKK